MDIDRRWTAKQLEQAQRRDPRDIGDHGVSERPQPGFTTRDRPRRDGAGRLPVALWLVGTGRPSVHPTGKPIIASTHAGFRHPGWSRSCSDSGSEANALGFVCDGDFPSRQVGVAHSLVGDEEDALAVVGRAQVGRPDSRSFHRVTEAVEPGDNRVQLPPSESGDVLDDDAARAHLFEDPEVFVPQAGALAAEAEAVGARVREILAGKPAADDIDGLEDRRADRSDIAPPRDIRPADFEDRAAHRVDLDLPGDGAEARGGEAELESADA